MLMKDIKKITDAGGVVTIRLISDEIEECTEAYDKGMYCDVYHVEEDMEYDDVCVYVAHTDFTKHETYNKSIAKLAWKHPNETDRLCYWHEHPSYPKDKKVIIYFQDSNNPTQKSSGETDYEVIEDGNPKMKLISEWMVSGSHLVFLDWLVVQHTELLVDLEMCESRLLYCDPDNS